MSISNKEKILADAIEALAARVGRLEHQIAFVRKRLADIYPERSYCPKCKALVHKTARACSCGATWGPQPPPPDAGLPAA
jgi:hypothetical protein